MSVFVGSAPDEGVSVGVVEFGDIDMGDVGFLIVPKSHRSDFHVPPAYKSLPSDPPSPGRETQKSK